MTRLIVSAYSSLLDLLLFALLLAGASAAYQLIPDALFKGDFYAYKDVIKIAVGVTGTFILEVLLFGPFLILEDIRNTVSAINTLLLKRNNDDGDRTC